MLNSGLLCLNESENENKLGYICTTGRLSNGKINHS